MNFNHRLPLVFVIHSMSDDEYEIPLTDQRIFGAGIKRQRVRFVPSSRSANASSTPSTTSSAQDVASRYLSLVLPSQVPSPTTSPRDQTLKVCEVCKLPVTNATYDTTIHNSSLAHQVCLPHSHPPSHIDRQRKGLSILSAYGYDPDSRQGLGSSGQGIQYPIKVKEKSDKLGVGVVVPSDAFLRKKAEERAAAKAARKKLDAGQVRKRAVEEGKRRERLQRAFYGRDDLVRHLKPGNEWE